MVHFQVPCLFWGVYYIHVLLRLEFFRINTCYIMLQILAESRTRLLRCHGVTLAPRPGVGFMHGKGWKFPGKLRWFVPNCSGICLTCKLIFYHKFLYLQTFSKFPKVSGYVFFKDLFGVGGWKTRHIHESTQFPYTQSFPKPRNLYTPGRPWPRGNDFVASDEADLGENDRWIGRFLEP